MANQFITSTPRGQLEALAYQGILAIDTHAQIHSLLLRHLSLEHALLFAEPMPDEARQVIDWYSPAEGEKRNFTSLQPEAQSAALSRLSGLVADIQNLTAELLKSGEGPQNMRGHILSLALKYPGDNHVFLCGKQPVITSWGCIAAARGMLGGEVSRAGALKPPPASHELDRHGGWFWLKILLLLIILYCLAALFFGPPGCHESWPFQFRPPGFGGCPLPPEVFTEIPAPPMGPQQNDELKAAEEEEKKLREEYEKLWRQLNERAEECRPEEPVPPISEESTAGEALKIPDEAQENNDFSFLDGCWICESGLSNTATGEPIVMEFCFDAEGRGRQSIDDLKWGNCQGAVQANFTDDQLHMDAEWAVCEKGSRYVPSRIICREENGEALCTGQDMSEKKPGDKWSATFRRK